jgi:choline dehydrogenase-like flavoprotein
VVAWSHSRKGDLLRKTNDRFPPSSVQPLGGALTEGDSIATELPSSAARPRRDYDSHCIAPSRDEHRRFVRAFVFDLLRAGMIPTVKPIPLGGTAHACGTLIAGDDPQNSVVDASGGMHGMTNLYVVDGSALPRSSRVNPALTIYAWAPHVADKLDQSLGAVR